MMTMRPSRWWLVATAAAFLLALPPTLPTNAAAPPAQAYPDAVPAWANPAHLAKAADDSFEAEGEFFLPLRDPQGAEAEATAISTPGNPKYHHFMSPEQWMAQHSPTPADYDQVVDFLTSHGATITAEPTDREFIVFRQKIYFTDSTFKTTMQNYRVDGRIRVAPATAPKLPADIAAKVSAVMLGDGRAHSHPTANSPSDGPTNPPTKVIHDDANCSYAYGQTVMPTPEAYGHESFPTGICGYEPDALRSGVGAQASAASGNDGSGQTVAIVGTYDSPTLLDDVNNLAQYTNTTPLLTSQFNDVTDASTFNDEPLCGGPAGWQEENTMDVEAVHATAPGAKITYVGAFNCGGGSDTALAHVIDNHLANIVSNSYSYIGENVGLGLIRGEQNLQLQAAAEGIGLYFASGDDGDNKSIDVPSANWPATSPWVTAVGGTTIAVDSDQKKVFETGWENGFAEFTGTKGKLQFSEKLPGHFSGGSGGGRSIYFGQPEYQKGIVPDHLAKNASATPMRAMPDIATDANPLTPMLIGYQPIGQTYFQVKLGAGTSLATPLMAGKVADAQQAGGKVLGFANPALYAQYGADKAHFGDVKPLTDSRYRAFGATLDYEQGTPRYVVSTDTASTWKTLAGYDLVTGLGDPTIAALTEAASR